MPDQRRSNAIAKVETDVIQKFQGVRQLTVNELVAHGSASKKFVAGWQFASLIPGDDYHLRLLLPDTFPFGRPRVAIDRAPAITWPHLEDGNLLCLAEDNDPHTPENVVAVCAHAIMSGRTLVNDCLAAKNFDQLEDEFISYWQRWAKWDTAVRSVCRADGPTRTVSAWYGKSFTVVAEDDTSLRSWLERFFGGQMEDRNFKPRAIPFIWLQSVLQPNQYPTTADALLRLVESDMTGRTLIENLLCDDKIDTKLILLGCRTRRGVGLGAVKISKPQAGKGTGDPLRKGFRTVPPRSILLARYAAAPAIGGVVVRCDAPWVHGRDNNPDIEMLQAKSVVILGVGSVGSPVATLLAEAGVGRLHLVDPQSLQSENTGRHELGATSVLQMKAPKHAANLGQRFPHVAVAYDNKRWQDVFRENPTVLASASLIISTMGDWPSEAELNATVFEQTDFPPVLYGWTEPHAAAGHAAVFVKRTGCLRCLTDDLGHLRVPVTSWTGITTKAIPACGGSFQPYGATELAHINALIASVALDVLLGRVTASTHYTWIGRRKLLQRGGGTWNPEWIRVHSDPEEGGQIVERLVAVDSECPECTMKR